MTDNNNQLDRLLKISIEILRNYNSKASELLNIFPGSWSNDQCNEFLDQLLEYCSQNNKQYWEHAAVIRDVKKTINEQTR